MNITAINYYSHLTVYHFHIILIFVFKWKHKESNKIEGILKVLLDVVFSKSNYLS